MNGRRVATWFLLLVAVVCAVGSVLAFGYAGALRDDGKSALSAK
ncbi:MAG: hypothetical protein ACRCZD_16610 [Phycicoccus sp.]